MFPDVVLIRGLKLVFNDHSIPVPLVLSDQIALKGLLREALSSARKAGPR